MSEKVAGRSAVRNRSRSIAFVGLSIALIAVSAWVVIPFGPVPFTMQMFMITLVICIMTPKETIAAIYGYVALGALGVPVFSGVRGGLGVILGPTGGFLLGYLIFVPAAAGFLFLMRKRFESTILAPICAGLIFTFGAYITGTIQYMSIANISMEAALATSVIPFVIPDIIKVVLAVIAARIINAAIGSRA